MKNIKYIFIILFLTIGSVKKVWSIDNTDIQMNYVLAQFAKTMQSGTATELQLLVSDNFKLGNDEGLTAKSKLGKIFKDIVKPINIEFELLNPLMNDFLAKAKLLNGKKITFGLRLNKFYEFERIGLFEQSLGLIDPILNANQKLKLIEKLSLKKINNKLYFPLRINNGKEIFNFMFDSGAGASMIDSTLAISLGLVTKKDANGVTTSSGIVSDFSSIENLSFQFSKIQIQSSKLLLSNLQKFTKVAGLKVDGIIGYDLLKNFIVKLDNQNLTLSIYSGGVLNNVKGITVGIEMYKNTPIIPIKLSSKEFVYNGKFMFDSGLTEFLVLNTAGKFRSKIEANNKTNKKTAAMDVAGNYQEKESAVIEKIEIAGKKIMNVNISMDSANDYQWSAIDGLIGMNLIDNFNVWFDYPNRFMKLESIEKSTKN